MELLAELLTSVGEQSGFLRSKIDMTLLGWVVMFLCLCLDGINCTLAGTDGDNASTPPSVMSGKKKDKQKDGKLL